MRTKRPFGVLALVCFFLLTGLFSCGNEPAAQSSTTAEKEKEETTAAKLQGKWENRRDMSHTVVFEDNTWIDQYNEQLVSRNPLEFYAEYPRPGVKPSSGGRFIRLEEGENPGNYFVFEILKLEADKLELQLIGSDQIYLFRRWQASDSPRYSGYCGGCDITALFSDAEGIGTNVRDWPGTDGEMLFTLEAKEGEQLTLQIRGWYEDWVQLENVIGKEKEDKVEKYRFTWIKAHFASVKVVLASGNQEVAVYNEPDRDAAVVDRVKPGTRLTVTGCCGEWVRVSGVVSGWLAPGSFTP